MSIETSIVITCDRCGEKDSPTLYNQLPDYWVEFEMKNRDMKNREFVLLVSQYCANCWSLIHHKLFAGDGFIEGLKK